jgi:hypothetical protein
MYAGFSILRKSTIFMNFAIVPQKLTGINPMIPSGIAKCFDPMEHAVSLNGNLQAGACF